LSIYLFIQLPAGEAINQDCCVQWLHWDSNLADSIASGKAHAKELMAIAAKHSHSINVLITPGEAVRSINASLPNKSKAAMSTIPFQLEEHLSSKLEHVHIASGQVIDGQVRSLVVDNAIMQQWQKFGEQSQITFRYIVPDFSLLPVQDDGGSLWSDGQRILINSLAFQGSMSALAYQQFQSVFWPKTSALLTLYSAAGELTQFPAAATHANTDLLKLITAHFTETPQANLINLAQGQYQPSSQASLPLKRFLAPTIALALLLLSLIALAVTDNYQLAKQNQQQETQMISLYKSLFPNDRRINDPYAQMRGKLKNTAINSKQNFLSWLATVAPLLKQHKIKLVNLKYNTAPRALRLQIEASDYNSLENFASAINQQQKTPFNASLGTLQKSSLKQSVTSLLTLRETKHAD